MTTINSNRTFIDLGFEGAWGNEAVDWAAGDQLDVEGATGGETISNLVQPRQPATIRILFTDTGVEISAFQVDVVGTDDQGNAATDQFLFAGGLDQTGTQLFKTVTSVTLTSITESGATAKTLDVYWKPMRKLVPVLGYDVNLDNPVREQPHIQGDQDAFYAVQDRRNLGGSIRVGVWPHLTRKLLDLATLRNTDADIDSFCARDDIPGIECRVHAGLKVDSLTIEGGVEGDLTMSLDVRGRHEETESNLTYPGTYVVPEIPAMTFKNARFVISLNAGGDDNFANRIQPVGLSNFSLSLRNNLKIGPPVEDRVDLEKDGVPEYCTASRKNLEVRFTASFDRQAYATLNRQRLYAQFKMVSAHPSYTNYATVAGAGASAGSSVVVTLGADPSAWLSVGDVVLFDNAGGGNLPCVGTVTAIAPGTPSVTIDVLDENVAVGDHMFTAALELRTAPIAVQTSPIQKNFDDTLLVEVSGQIFSGGFSPLTYKVRDLALP